MQGGSKLIIEQVDGEFSLKDFALVAYGLQSRN